MHSVRNGRVQYKNDELPVAFHDESLFENKKSGVLITTKRIYHITAFQSNVFELTDSHSICSFNVTNSEGKQYCYIKWCSEVNNIEIGYERSTKAHNVLCFWGNLFNFLITKQHTDIFVSTQPGYHSKIFSLLANLTNGTPNDTILTPIQENMLSLLLAHSFSDYDKKQEPRLEDWGNLNESIIACEKYSLLTWAEYAFYTQNTLYYHCKKQKIHRLIHYSGINSYDADTCILDYGSKHEKIDISFWTNGVKSFINQIAIIKKITSEYDTSTLEFCFNRCSEFRSNLKYFKVGKIKSAFFNQCQQQHASNLLCENFEHIEIKSMNKGKIELQFWAYFRRVETITINEDDSEYDRREKEIEQERLYQEAEERVEIAQYVASKLPNIKDDIVNLFQMAIYNLYGVIFDKENIIYLEEPDFTFEGPTLAKRIQNKVASVKSVLDSMMESTERQMADVERKYNKDKK